MLSLNRVPERSGYSTQEEIETDRTWRLLSWGERYTLFAGKIRRFYTGKFRKGYVAQQEIIRGGECGRCGVCCKLLFKCPFLAEEVPGQYMCKIHGNRPENCRMFPINERDLRERDIVAPGTTCGYNFD